MKFCKDCMKWFENCNHMTKCPKCLGKLETDKEFYEWEEEEDDMY